MTPGLDHLSSLSRQLYVVRGKIISLRQRAKRINGTAQESKWSENDRMRLRKLKTAANTLQERITAITGHFEEAA